MDDLLDFILCWLLIVGGYTLLLFTLRLMAWIWNGVMLGGWF